MSKYQIKNFMQSMSEKGQLQEPSLTFIFSGRPLEVKPRRQHLQQGVRARLTHTHSYLLYVVARFRTSLNKHYI